MKYWKGNMLIIINWIKQKPLVQSYNGGIFITPYELDM